MVDFKNLNTKENIMLAAKKEFLSVGYKDASLRTICKNAGVTTGALYFFFKNKEDLLDTILLPVIEGYKKLIRNLFTGARESNEYSTGDSMLIEYLYENREVAIILIDKCRGTKYDELLKNVRDGMKHGFESLFKANGITDFDDSLVEILVSMKIDGYLNILKNNYTHDQLKSLSSKISVYWDCGFFSLLQEMKKQRNSEPGL